MTKVHSRKDHPCLSCPLADCDDNSPRCPLRKALSEQCSRRKKGLPIDDDLKRRSSIAFNEIYAPAKQERMRLRKEAARLQAEGGQTTSSSFLTEEQASKCLRLWATKQFDTMEIAEFVCANEDAVCRTIQAARDIIREVRP